MAEKTVRLADIPDPGPDLEDYVAALFQASGYFVEKNLVQRDPEEVLELDIVATDYSGDEPVSVLAEAKGGNWGYPDIFKILGWMQYLGQPQGAFFVGETDKDLDAIRQRLTPFHVAIVSFGDFSAPIQAFEAAGLGMPANEAIVQQWRFSYRLERRLLTKEFASKWTVYAVM